MRAARIGTIPKGSGRFLELKKFGILGVLGVREMLIKAGQNLIIVGTRNRAGLTSLNTFTYNLQSPKRKVRLARFLVNSEVKADLVV